jgi:hypothetical protein
MDRPVITWIRGWLTPKAPTVPEIEPAPAPPIPQPSNIQIANYIRAFWILRSIPGKKLWAAFLSLPLRRISYAIGCVIWAIMTYSFITYILRSF